MAFASGAAAGFAAFLVSLTAVVACGADFFAVAIVMSSVATPAGAPSGVVADYPLTRQVEEHSPFESVG